MGIPDGQEGGLPFNQCLDKMIRNYFIHATYFILTLAIWIPGWQYQANNALLEQFSPSNPLFAEEVQRGNRENIGLAKNQSASYPNPKNRFFHQGCILVDSLCQQVNYSAIASDKQVYQTFRDTLYQQTKPFLTTEPKAEAHLDYLLDINKVTSLSTVPFTYGQLFDVQKAIVNSFMQVYFCSMTGDTGGYYFEFDHAPIISTNILFPSTNDTFILKSYMRASPLMLWGNARLTGRINDQEYQGKEGAIRYQTTFRKPGKQPLAMELCLTNSKNGKMVLRDTVWVNVQK